MQWSPFLHRSFTSWKAWNSYSVRVPCTLRVVLTQGERTVRKYNFRLPGNHISIYQNQKSPRSSFQEYVNQRPSDLVATLWNSTSASLTNSEKMEGEWLVKSWLFTHHNIVTDPKVRSAPQRGMCSPLRPFRNHVGVFQIHSVPYCP